MNSRFAWRSFSASTASASASRAPGSGRPSRNWRSSDSSSKGRVAPLQQRAARAPALPRRLFSRLANGCGASGAKPRERRRDRALEHGGGVERVERPCKQLAHQRRGGARRGRAVAHQVVDHEQRVRAQPPPLEQRVDLRFEALRGRRQRRAAGGAARRRRRRWSVQTTCDPLCGQYGRVPLAGHARSRRAQPRRARVDRSGVGCAGARRARAEPVLRVVDAAAGAASVRRRPGRARSADVAGRAARRPVPVPARSALQGHAGVRASLLAARALPAVHAAGPRRQRERLPRCAVRLVRRLVHRFPQPAGGRAVPPRAQRRARRARPEVDAEPRLEPSAAAQASRDHLRAAAAASSRTRSAASPSAAGSSA